METLTLPGRKTGRFLRMGMSKKLGGFGSGSGDMLFFDKNNCIIFHYIANGHSISSHSCDIVCYTCCHGWWVK